MEYFLIIETLDFNNIEICDLWGLQFVIFLSYYSTL